jgi:hypothetical protein
VELKLSINYIKLEAKSLIIELERAYQLFVRNIQYISQIAFTSFWLDLHSQTFLSVKQIESFLYR